MLLQNIHPQRSKSLLIRTLSTTATAPALEAKYFVPRAERKDGKSLFKFEMCGDEPRLARINRFSPTRELNFTPESWEKHKSPWRRVRHIRTTLQSSPFQRLAFPDLCMTGSIGVALSYYNTEIATDYASQILLDGSAMAGATTAIGLLAAFRLNTR